MSELKGHKSRNFGLDLMRFLAIVLVLFGHGRHLLFPKLERAVTVLKGGYYGVELFFILSGFLIGSIFFKNVVFKDGLSWSSLKSFWIRRWFRTLPNYYLAIIVHLVTYYLLFGHFGEFSILYLFFLQNFAWENYTFFGAAWSLSVEEWFYLTLPVFSVIGIKLLKFKSTLMWLILIIVSFTAFRFYFNYNNPDISFHGGSRNIVIIRLDSIMFGVVVAYLFLTQKAAILKRKYFLLAAGIIFIALSYLLLEWDLNNPYTRTFSFTLVNCGVALVLPWFYDLRTPKSFISNWVHHIAVISYSMYLYHQIPIIRVLKLYWHPNGAIENLLRFGVYWAVTIIFSTIVYQYFEIKMTALRSRFSQKENKDFS
jgi:peptidoglycan/LPS O-acetylase OafA/YrhL